MSQLTKVETIALWHAVDAYSDMIRAMHSVPGISQEQINAERERLAVAKRALRKVNELRKQGL